MPDFTPPPTPPNIGDPSTFATRASAFVSWMATFASEIEAWAWGSLNDAITPVKGHVLAHDGSQWAPRTLRTVTLGPFYKADMAAGDTAAMEMGFAQTPSTFVTFDRAMKMPRAGRVVGGYLALDSARTGGTCTLRVSVNGATTDFAGGAVQLNGTDNDSNSAEVAYADGVAFAAGADLKPALTTSAGWTVSSGNDLIAWLIVVLDPF